MKKLSKKEELKVKGGNITYSATFINAVCRIIDIIFSIGQNVGSSIRKTSEKGIVS